MHPHLWCLLGRPHLKIEAEGNSSPLSPCFLPSADHITCEHLSLRSLASPTFKNQTKLPSLRPSPTCVHVCALFQKKKNIKIRQNSIASLFEEVAFTPVMPFLPRLSFYFHCQELYTVKKVTAAEHLTLSPEAHPCSFFPSTKPNILSPASDISQDKWKSFTVGSSEKGDHPWAVTSCSL